MPFKCQLFSKVVFQINNTHRFYLKVQPGNLRLLLSNSFVSFDCLRKEPNLFYIYHILSG